MNPPTARQLSSYWPIIVPAVLIAVIIAGLYGFVPYSAGYNEQRISIFAFARAMWKLEEWQHCIFVPFIVAVLIYLDWKKLVSLPIEGSRLGWPLIGFGLIFFWFGYGADVVYFGYISAQILIAGLILLFFGKRWMLALGFAWLFINFMWPLLFLENQIALPLRGVMSKASNAVLNFIGIPSMLSGTAILSAGDAVTGRKPGEIFSVDVAEPCSGIRSLFALMMVSALYAHFAVNEWWKKWILFLCSAPLAVLGNLCRILMLTIGTIAMGAPTAIGTHEDPSTFHMFAGYLVFAVAILGMFGVGALLNADWGRILERLKARSGGFEKKDSSSSPDKHKDDIY